MAVAHDAVTESSTWTTTPDPFTFDHTPAGTPAGVGVFIASDGSSDQIDGTVSYGGVAMTRVGYCFDATGETGASWLYYLGSGVPTGTQTVSISHTASADTKWSVCFTVTASTDTEIGSVANSTQDESAPLTNPIIQKGEQTGLAYFGLYHGALLSNLTLVSGMTDLNTEHELASACFRFDRETSVSSGPVTIGYTQGSGDDIAFIGVNVKEVGTSPYVLGAQRPTTVGATTTWTLTMGGELDGKDMYAIVTSRDSTSASGDTTCTDTSGANTWTPVSSDADKKLWVWWKLGTQADVGARLTIASGVGSTSGGLIWCKGTDGANGDPTTNLTLETNASGNETHAGIDPTNDDSIVVFAIGDYGNDTNVPTVISGATMGSLEPEWFQAPSSGGSDSLTTVTARTLASGATGDITWSQTNSTTKSVLFAVAPEPSDDVSGTGASTLEDVTSDGDGTYTPPAITGTGTSTFGDVTSAGSGTYTPPPITGSGSSTLEDVTSAGTGTFVAPITGTGSSTLGDVTSSGTGVLIIPITGTGSSTLGDVTSSGQGFLGVNGAGSSTLGDVTSSGSGTYTPPAISGTGASTLGDITSSGAGTFLDPITGSGASTLDDVTSSGVGVLSVAGKIENVVCDLLFPDASCDLLSPEGDCDLTIPLTLCDLLAPEGTCDLTHPLVECGL